MQYFTLKSHKKPCCWVSEQKCRFWGYFGGKALSWKHYRDKWDATLDMTCLTWFFRMEMHNNDSAWIWQKRTAVQLFETLPLSSALPLNLWVSEKDKTPNIIFINTKPEMWNANSCWISFSVISNTIIIVPFWTETDFLSDWGTESHSITAFSLIAVWSKSQSFHVLCLGITVVDTFGRAEAIIFLRLPYDFMQVNRCLVCFLITGRCVNFLRLITSDFTIHSSICTMH